MSKQGLRPCVHYNIVYRLGSIDTQDYKLTEGMVVVYTTGNFGWGEMPFAFDVITRTIRRLANRQLAGRCECYVDDVMGCSPTSSLPSDIGTVVGTIQALLGPDAENQGKREQGRRLDWLGWSMDLDLRTVTIAKHNFLKTMYEFFNFDVEGVVSVNKMETLASLASRYSMLCWAMKPYTHQFYSFISGTRNTRKSRKLDSLAQFDVLMWRSYLVVLRLDESTHSRPFDSFCSSPPTIRIEYDASLFGIGVALSTRTDVTVDEWSLEVYSQIVLPYDLEGDSSYQNSCEFLAIVLGLAIAARLGHRNFTFHVCGDNTTSLAWATSGRVRSDRSRATAIMYTALVTRIGAHFGTSEHVRGVDNVIMDGLSRGLDPAGLRLDPHKHFVWDDYAGGVEILHLCNPTISYETMSVPNMMEGLRSINSVIDHLL